MLAHVVEGTQKVAVANVLHTVVDDNPELVISASLGVQQPSHSARPLVVKRDLGGRGASAISPNALEVHLRMRL